MSRDFKGIWIPREIWLSTELSMQEKVFLAEIHSLDNEQGCIASNAYFAEFFQLSKSSISRIISSLSAKGLCDVSLIYKNNKEVDRRVIRCTKYGDKEIIVEQVITETATRTPISEADTKGIKEILDYLNLTANKRYRVGSAFNKVINARISEGYKLDDFKHVIDVKCSQWIDTDFDKFLRPSTLFSISKFPEYLSEKFIRGKKELIEDVAKAQKGFYDV